jgi:uncharacterized protein (DUF305 family)
MTKVAVGLAAAALLAAGCGGDNEESAEDRTNAPSAASVPFDRAFIDVMVPHHESAIEMAREAKAAGLSQAELVAIADRIVVTQQREIDQMLAWREEWFGPGEPESEQTALQVVGLSAEEAGMTMHAGELSAAADVDKEFATMMIAHHEGAVRMAKIAEERAGHDEIKRLARAIVAAQEREIEVMKPHAEGEHH